MSRYLALALSFLTVFSGCSTYSARPVNASKIDVMPFWRTEGPITIGVDPYIQTDRQKEVFDADLEKAGVLPIYVLIKNNSDRSLSLRHEDITLEYPSGYQISPVQTDTVLRMLGRKPSIGLAIVGALGFGGFYPLIPFAVAGAMVEKRVADTQGADYLNKEFKDVVLSKDESAHGFIYLMPPSSGLEALKGKLILHFVDETGSDFVIRVPVS